MNWTGFPPLEPGELADVNVLMRQDLDRVLRVVSGEVALSEELHMYMYGPQRGIEFAEFRWMARNRMNNLHPHTLGPEQEVAVGMVNITYISLQKHTISCRQFKSWTHTCFILLEHSSTAFWRGLQSYYAVSCCWKFC